MSNIIELLIKTKNDAQSVRQAKQELSEMARTTGQQFDAATAAADKLSAAVARVMRQHPDFNRQDAVNYVRAMEELKGTVDGTGKSFDNASIAARGLSQEFGIALPRTVTSFLAKTETIGPLLSGAFSAIAVVGMIEALGQLPALFDKLSGALTGWDEKRQKAFQEFIADNKKAADSLVDFNAKMQQIDAPTAHLGEVAAAKAHFSKSDADTAYYLHNAKNRRDEAADLIRNSGSGVFRNPEGMTASQLNEDAEKWKKLADEAAEKTKGFKRELDALNETLKQENARKFGEELDGLTKIFGRNQVSANALSAAITAAGASHRTVGEMVHAYGQQAQEAAKAANNFGIGIKDNVERLADMAEALNFANHHFEAMNEVKQTIAAGLAATAKAQEEFNTFVKNSTDSIATAMGVASATTVAALNNELDAINAVAQGYDTLAEKKRKIQSIVGAGPEDADQEDWRKPMDVANNPNLAIPGHQFVGQGLQASLDGMRHISEASVVQEHMVMEMTWNHWNKLGQEAINSISQTFGQMFADSIAHGQNFWQAFKNLGKDAVASVAKFFVENFAQGLLNPFKTSIGRTIGTAGSSVANNLGGKALGALGLGSLFGGVAHAAGPAVTMMGSASVIKGIGGALDLATPAAPAGAGGLASMGAFFSNPWTIGIAAGILGGIGLYKIFHHDNNAPFTRDPHDIERNRTIFFFTGMTDAMNKFSNSIDGFTNRVQTMQPGDVVTVGMPQAMANSNQFKRNTAKTLSNDD